jgi:hypothetical protein
MDLNLNIYVQNVGTENEVSILPYINFDENPEYYALVKNLDIFNVKCTKCGHEEMFQFDTLIVDPTHKYFLYLFCDEEKINSFRKNIDYFVNTVLNASEIKDWDLIKTRLVLDFNSLVEKMAIFEIGLNDKAIEFIKAGLKERNIVKSKNAEILFDGLNQTNLEFISIDENENLDKVNVSINFYNKIIENINNLKDDKINFELIDQNWVKSKIED